MAIITSPLAGVDIAAVVAGTGTSSDEGDQFALGTKVDFTDGQMYMRVHAATAITQYDAVGIDEDFEASALTKAMADDAWTIGTCQITVADNEFFWVALEGSGNLKVRCAANCAPDVSLYTTGTAGILDDTAASQTKIEGITALGAASASIRNKEVIARSLHVELPA